MNAKQMRTLAVVLVIHVILVRFTWRDLRRRPDAAVRGPKRLWRLASGVNTTGVAAYWLFGRRAARGPAASAALGD